MQTSPGELRYADAGPANGLCVVLLHGWSSSRVQWRYQVASLAKRYRTLAIDLPGHGANPPEPGGPPPTVEAFADRVFALIETKVRYGPVVLIGHALGSAVAVEVARRLDSRAALVVALDGLVRLDVYERQDEPAAAHFLAPLTENYREAALAYLESLVLAHDRLNREELERTHSNLGREFGLALFHSLLTWDMAGCLAATQVPITALCASATLDADVYEQYGTRLDIVPIAGIGHFLHMEGPQIVNPLLHGLLECWRYRHPRLPVRARSLHIPHS